jgi:amino acid adenylation domain-containing protein
MELPICNRIQRLFETQVARSPNAAAIAFGTRLVPYRELNARANALAHRLVAAGVKPGTLVGLLSGRSIEMVAGILGILKAGAAYVPLNVDYPLERLAFVVRDAGLPLVVATADARGLTAALQVPILDFPEEHETSEAPPDVEDASDTLAYVIYTSGSTGQPKGVGLPHVGLVSLLSFTREQMQIRPGDRVLQFASFSFDASLWEILAALVSGATLVLGTSQELMSGPWLHALMRKQGVTIALLSPSVLQTLPSDNLDALRIIIAGTEKLTGSIVSRWKSPKRRFFNAYGPTEATIYQLIWEAPDGPPPDNPPIGAPVPGVQAYLLDDNLKPVEEGAAGELCLAGACLGAGYINRPELTRRAFTSTPLGVSGEAIRIYRTGDRARRRPDGNYEFLGRLDLQVKVRGFRVEPSEIETVLAQHPGIDSSAVVAAPDGSSQMRLWAFFIPRANPPPATTALKAFLAAKLPAYMIPSGFTALSHWPLNANAKLDRAQLPLPGREFGRQSVAACPPARRLSPSEQQLLTWCCEILGVDELEPDDSLLNAGFYSLAFAQLAWRIQSAFGAAPSFADMFNHASISGLASLIDARSDNRRSPVDRDMTVDGAAAVARDERPPLSSAQKRVWFLEQLHPNNNAYRFQSILRFHGSTDVRALERALNEIVKRHEILRTTFPQHDGRPFQKIHAYQAFALAVESLSAAEAQAEIDRCIRQPFDLDQLPLVRWRLFRVGPLEYWLLHTEHHLLHDGWGYGIFLRELFAAYDALASGRQPDLPPLPAQFADLAAWQERQLDRGVWDSQLDYWERTLRNAGAPPRLPSDGPPPSITTFAGAQIRHAIDQKLYADLMSACLREQATPYMWLHAAFQTFLYRYTGHADIVVGSGVANRRPDWSRDLLGMMINTVALRTDFAGDPVFRDVLAHLRGATIQAIDNQDAPYEKVISRLKPGGELFNCFFDSYDQAFPAYRNEHIRIEAEEGIGNGRCKFDLTVLVIPGEGAPTLLWEYNTDLFERSTAERMMRHFLALVSSSVEHPDLPVSRLPLLSGDERNHLIQLGRGRESLVPGDRIERVFAEHASAHPNAEAVICGNERLSYAELDRRAEDLAVQLGNVGVVAGDVVAFSLPRGSTAICAMLAILKCGCSYMPLDPALPTARRDVLLKAASATAILTSDGIAAPWAVDAPARPCREPSEDAYVMFTSGSTGSPKAVYAPHSGVIRLVCDVDYARLDASTRFLQLAPLSFDASTLEIWGPLLNGGTVVVHTEDVPELTALANTIAAHKVTTSWLTAALFNRIVDAAPHILRPLREVLTGGEALSPRHVARALTELPSTVIINGYGPTESTTFATTYRVPRKFSPLAPRVPIGAPVPRTQAYVLDNHRQLQPIGVAGELHIGGAGLGRFVDSSHASAFVPDPFASSGGSRLYPTGDRACLLADGNFDFLGRLDRQVKLHGYRIEPGEIESVIGGHPDVREVAVVAAADAGGDRRLIAYLVLAPQAGVSAVEAVREFASCRLPSYMVPSRCVAVPSLPLSPNGKLDERALQRMAAAAFDVRNDAHAPGDGCAHKMPRTSLQAVVAGVWEQVLGTESPSIDDNFFDVGGHSLPAMQLMHKLNIALGLKLPLRLLFTNPTIAGVARAIEAEFVNRFNQREGYAALVPLKPGGDLLPLFLVAGGVGGENELIVYAGLARYLDPRRPFFGLRARGIDELLDPHDSVGEMAAEYIREIRRVQPEGPYTISGSCISGVVALEMAQQLRRDGQKVRTLLLIDSFMPRWSRLIRNELANYWRDRLGPDIERAQSQGLVQFARDWRRRRFNPSPDERIALRQIRIMRTYLTRLTAYRPQSYPGRIVLLRAAQTNAEEAIRWRSIATGAFEMREIPGDHVSHLREYAKETATAIEQCLEADDPTTGS